jgi:ABC-type amino acid transport substrate-binding protein
MGYSRQLFIFILLGICSSVFAADKQLRVVVFENHQNYLDASHSYALAWDVFNLAAEQAGIELLSQEDAWIRSIKSLQDHKVDVVFAAVKNAERAQWAKFSLPLAYDHIVLLESLNKDTDKIADIDFETASVGVTRNSVQEQMAKDIGFKNIYSTVDRNQIYKMLEYERLDYLLYSQSISNFYCMQYHFSQKKNCLKVVGKPLQQIEVHGMYVSENSRANSLVSAINKVLKELDHDHWIAPLFKSHGFSREVYQQWQKTINGD